MGLTSRFHLAALVLLLKVLIDSAEAHPFEGEDPPANDSRILTVRANSEGYGGLKEPRGIAPMHDGLLFYVNDEPVGEKIWARGINILSISRETGEVLKAENFDTNKGGKSVDAMWNHVFNLPDDTIVMLSVLDDTSQGCTVKCLAAINEIGGDITSIGFREGYALIGYKGSHCGARPSWRREFKQMNTEYDRSGHGPKPIGLVAKIDLDNCY